MTTTTSKLTRNDWQTALDVQGGCNLSGIVFSFAQIMQRICDEANATGRGTDWKNTHPISVLFASKIASLTGCESFDNVSAAFDAVELYLATTKEDK